MIGRPPTKSRNPDPRIVACVAPGEHRPYSRFNEENVRPRSKSDIEGNVQFWRKPDIG